MRAIDCKKSPWLLLFCDLCDLGGKSLLFPKVVSGLEAVSRREEKEIFPPRTQMEMIRGIKRI